MQQRGNIMVLLSQIYIILKPYELQISKWLNSLNQIVLKLV
jgi:hypothetical protein